MENADREGLALPLRKLKLLGYVVLLVAGPLSWAFENNKTLLPIEEIFFFLLLLRSPPWKERKISTHTHCVCVDHPTEVLCERITRSFRGVVQKCAFGSPGEALVGVRAPRAL